MTLPGLESVDADRSSITLADHFDAICEAVTAAGPPVVLVHSGAGAPGYAASDRIPDQIAAMVYVDSGPATGALDPDFDAVEKPLPPREEPEQEESLEGLTEEHLEAFWRRAVPQPGAALREAAELTNDARLDVPPVLGAVPLVAGQVEDLRPGGSLRRQRRRTNSAAALAVALTTTRLPAKCPDPEIADEQDPVTLEPWHVPS